MSNEVLEFGGFRLEPAERRLSRDGAVVEVSGRYLDALLLLAGRPGELVTKERFMAEVWRGIPVTDEALTQCIRTLRKALGDEAGRPRFIATVPRHGYRFVVEVTTAGGAQVEDEASAFPDGSFGGGSSDQVQPAITSHDKSGDASSGGGLPASSSPERAAASHLNVESGFKSRELLAELLLVAATGLAGGAAAGLVGGIGYGLIAATEPPAGTGAISILLVMTCLCVLIGLLGGLGVGSGSALGRLVGAGRLFPVMLGGALGGMAVGAIGRLIGLDAFSLLIGSRPLAITGGSEGLLIGAMVGAALWLAEREATASLPSVTGKGALLGSLAGLLVTIGGGKMMAGSLAGLAAAHPDAPLGTMLAQLTPTLLLAAGAIEGAIFVGALTLAFTLVLRSRGTV